MTETGPISKEGIVSIFETPKEGAKTRKHGKPSQLNRYSCTMNRIIAGESIFSEEAYDFVKAKDMLERTGSCSSSLFDLLEQTDILDDGILL